jgi:hypothetical protein
MIGFVAQLTNNSNMNAQIVSNLIGEKEEER